MEPRSVPAWLNGRQLVDWYHQLVDFYPAGWTPSQRATPQRGIVIAAWSKLERGRLVGYVRIRDLQGLIHPAIPLRLVTWLRQATPDDLHELWRGAWSKAEGDAS